MAETLKINRLLVIEDKTDDIFLVKNTLEHSNITFDFFDSAQTGKDAVNKLNDNEYDLIIMDFNLPDMTAIEIIDEIKGLDNNKILPILSLTASGNAKVAVELMKKGVFDYINKEDLDPDIFRTEIEYVLEKSNEVISRKKHIERLSKFGLYDQLTELPNRNLFYDRLDHAMKSVKRTNKKIAVLFIDLNDFKLINDNYGHNTGDIVISEVGKRLSNKARGADTIARYGGDEFTIILDGITVIEDAVSISQKLHDLILQPITIDDNEFVVTSAIGISICPDDTNDMNELIHLADKAMYEAKRQNKKYFHY